MPFFAFTDASRETFVMRLDDPALVAHARALLAGATEESPRIAGTVVKGPAAYNIGWSYRLDPKSIAFFDISTEVGDSTMRYIERHLGEVGGALLPDSRWTGWSSELVAELKVRSGQQGADCLAGTRGADLLLGKGGDDRLSAGAGDDHLSGGAGNDRLYGAQGDDKLGGDAGDDRLYGGAQDDVLDGGEGADRLTGGAGADRLHAGLADKATDTFVFAKNDSGLAKGTWDQVFGFQADTVAKPGQRAAGADLIDLSALSPGDQELRFVSAFTKAAEGEAAGQVRVVDAGPHVKVEVDWNGDNHADMIIQVMNVAKLTADDFLL